MPPIRIPTYGETPSILHTPHHAIYEQHTYLPTHLRRDTHVRHTDTNLHHGYRRQCVSCIRNRGGLDLSYNAGASCGRRSCGRREAGRYVCCWCGVVWDVEGGGDLPVRRHSYRGHRVELWRIADRLKNDKKQLKVKQSRQTRVYLGFIRQKQAQCF